jgi:hypothetical protein
MFFLFFLRAIAHLQAPFEGGGRVPEALGAVSSFFLSFFLQAPFEGGGRVLEALGAVLFLTSSISLRKNNHRPRLLPRKHTLPTHRRLL